MIRALLSQNLSGLFAIFSIFASFSLTAQGFPAEGACPSINTNCATPAVTSFVEQNPDCDNTSNYKLRLEFAAGGTTSDPSAFSNHYWVIKMITKDSCVYVSDPFTQGDNSGPVYVAKTGNSLIFDVLPGDFSYLTGGTNCTSTEVPSYFGGLDSVSFSIQQRCDSPGTGCSTFSASLGKAIPFSFDLIASKSSFQSPQDSSLYGYCSDNRVIYVDALLDEEKTINLSWYKDYKEESQYVYLCLQDWEPLAVSENYELKLTYGSNVDFNQTVADTWTEAGDSIKITSEEVDGQMCHKLSYSLDGDRMIDPLMNTSIKAKAVRAACQVVTQVSVDTSATTFSGLKFGWRSNMLTTNHKFKVRVYQGGTCDTTMVNPDTASTRPNMDNSYLQEFLIRSTDDNLNKFTVRDTIGGIIYLTDSFTLDVNTLGLDLEGCTCFQAFVVQICDGVNTGNNPSWSTGVNASTDCEHCEDGIQNGDETGIDCGGSCDPCENDVEGSTCEDGEQNGDETGIDCGGSCAPCEDPVEVPTCEDGEQNGDETGVDCGGSCAPCEDPIEEPTCGDGEQNGDETGVDCGGSCVPCQECKVPGSIWVDNFVRGRVTLNWTAVEGADFYKVQIKLKDNSRWYDFRTGETNLTIRGLGWQTDYEWRIAAGCSETESSWTDICLFNSNDPDSGLCGNDPTPTCEDGEQNGDETGVDCGGSCAPCEDPVEVPTCEDEVQNGDETGVDCGGSCAPCEDPVEVPTCEDEVQNGDETGVDCGGSCVPCEEPAEEPTCEDGELNGDETGVDCGGSCAPCDENLNCPVPENLNQNALGPFTILSWDRVNEGNYYNLQIRKQGEETWMNYPTRINRYVASRLQRGEVYEWMVQTVCGEEVSAWSAPHLFVAGKPGNASGTNIPPVVTKRELSLYPNPARDILNVVIPDFDVSITQLSIVDLNGKIWGSFKVEGGSQHLQINVSNFPKGLYFVKYEGQDQVGMKRILVQ